MVFQKSRKRLRSTTKNTSEKLRKQCVTLAKKIVRIQSKFTCEFCGKSEPQVMTHGSHIYSEGVHRGMSADIDNIITLCFTHHLGRWNAKEPSWHNNPIEMVEWFKNKWPERYEILKKRSQSAIQADEYYWSNKLVELKKIIAELNHAT